MKNYIVAKGGVGIADTSILVEWDAEAGTLRVSGDVIAGYEFENMVITRGVAGEDRLYWEGKNFHVTEQVHAHLEEEFTTLTLVDEYISADLWCTKKKRKIKNPAQFMLNWLKRAKGGHSARGGVVY